MTRIPVQVTVDLPAPAFRAVIHGAGAGSLTYVALPDLLDLIYNTADAFDKAHANADVSRAFRAFGDAIKESSPRA